MEKVPLRFPGFLCRDFFCPCPRPAPGPQVWTTPSASPATPAPLLCTPGHRPPWEAARAGSSGWEREAGGTQETPPVLAFAFQTLPHLGAHGRGCCWRSRVRRRDSGPQKARGSCPRRAPAGETLLGGAGSRVSTPEQPREGWPPPNPEPKPSQPRPPPPGARCGGPRRCRKSAYT